MSWGLWDSTTAVIYRVVLPFMCLHYCAVARTKDVKAEMPKYFNICIHMFSISWLYGIHCIQVIHWQAPNLDSKQCLLDSNDISCSEVHLTSSLNSITRGPLQGNVMDQTYNESIFDCFYYYYFHLVEALQS